MRKFSKIFIIGALLSCAGLSSADSLINKKTGRITALGHAKIEKDTIHWTPCFSEDTRDYRATEYKVMLGENCLPQGDRLPQTASPLPLIGMLGSVLVTIGLIMRMFRKTVRHRPNAN